MVCVHPVWTDVLGRPGLDTVEMIINETEMATVLCSPKEMKLLLDGKARCPSLKNLIVADKPSPELFQLAERLGV